MASGGDDIKISRKLVDLIIEVHCVFNDIDKVAAWMNTKNLNFGGCSPIQLVRFGKIDKVLQFVTAHREEGYTPVELPKGVKDA